MDFNYYVCKSSSVFKASVLSTKANDVSDVEELSSKDLHEESVDAQDLGSRYPTIIAQVDADEPETSLHVLKGLGAGVMGRVFLTRDAATSNVFALKVFRKKHILDCGEFDNIINERCCLGDSFENPFIVHLHASFQDDARLYMLMEFCPGGDLSTEVARWPKGMPMEKVMYYSAHLLEGIASLHDMGIIHRDLKPQNILISARGHLKISDFGAAMRTTNLDEYIEPPNGFGTVAYLPPEVIEGYHNSYIDWWCFGLILYEMVVGKHPFLEDCMRNGTVDVEELQESVMNGEYKIPETVAPSARKAIRGFMKTSPDRRWGACEGRRSEFFTGWDWQSVKRLEYEIPYIPVVKPNDATSNFDPEATDMKFVEDNEELLVTVGEDDEEIPSPAAFAGYECAPTEIEVPIDNGLYTYSLGRPPPRRFNSGSSTSSGSTERQSEQQSMFPLYRDSPGAVVTSCSLRMPTNHVVSVPRQLTEEQKEKVKHLPYYHYHTA